MSEATAFEDIMKNKDVQFEVDDRIEQAYRQGFEAGQAQYEEKHWNECRQISEYDAENKALKELLRRAIEDFRKLGDDGMGCLYEGDCEDCPLFTDKATECRNWNRENEAMKLIGGGDDA